MPEKLLLSITEIGGYPDFAPLYERLGYSVRREISMRKVLQFLKKQRPDVIVAEFNFQSDFRDRTSSLESMMAVLQRMPGIQIIVFYDKEYAHQLARLEERFTFAATLAFPLDESRLEKVLSSLSV